MTLHKKSMVLSLIFLIVTLCAFAGSKSVTVIRYGLIIGANNGGPDRTNLQYATKDAESFNTVMQEMGGLSPGNNILLLNPDITRIEHSFTAIKRLIVHQKKSAMRQEFIFYYSGHSDEEGLLIGEQKLSYKRLRELITTVPSDVRIAVIDSCASGVFIRAKGGVKKAPFMVDTSTEMKGYAFLTSSSETESAQESDKIKASFFTHYLISGLRGAADVSQDQVVTLNEAYHYTFKETLARTEKTQHGPQHPSYDIQLSGTGDLVLTDLREVTASLIIEENILGRIYIRNPKGDLIVELNKITQNKMEIGLSPGSYHITIDDNTAYYQADVHLAEGKKTNLYAKNLERLYSESTYARGDIDDELEIDGKYDYEYVPFTYSLFPGFPESKKENTIVKTSFSLNLSISENDMVQGCSLSLLGSTVFYDMHGFQGSGLYNIVWGDTVGASASIIFNMSYGNTRYSQTAAIFNYTLGTMEGVQASGIFNYAGMGISGAQLAALCNISEDISGAQVCAGLNLAKNVNGAQIGLFNLSQKVDGVQIGLINIAEENSGVALGLFNYSKDGIFNFEIWSEFDSLSYAGFKFGTRNFYTILLAGYDLIFDSQRWSLGIGWGAHIPVQDIFIDADVLCTSIQSGETDESYVFQETLLPQMRIKVGYTFFDTFGLFAGINLQFYHPELYYDKSYIDNALFSFPVPYSNEEAAIVPKFFFGVQLLK
ncbi:MAG: caspase family protein [Spirochaetales bacterium]|nr:caspase family protein [Spirochaetales bacterium]